MTYNFENASAREKKELCHEASRVFGRLAAEQLWQKLGLPGSYSPA